MRRNCNLELQLLPASSAADSGNRIREEAATMTIFYDGKVCVTDVTELQAREILRMASRETEESLRGTAARASPGGMSMKRSLQQFLQKRRNRVQATTPYRR